MTPDAGDQWQVWLVGQATDAQLLAEYQESAPGSVRRQRAVLAAAMRNFARIMREKTAQERVLPRGPMLTLPNGEIIGGRN
jgi:hypothetical protein